MGGRTGSIRYRQHSSWDHVTTQAPPLRQSRDTFGGGGRNVFGPKIDEATGDWRKLHNEELRDVFLIKYHLGDQMKEDEMGGTCGTCVGDSHAEFWWGYRRKGIVNT
jgi:hypothetical protein